MSQLNNKAYAHRSTSVSRVLRIGALVAACSLPIFVSACSENLIKHGQHFRATDLQQIQPGMSQDQVRLSLGTPSTTSRQANGPTYYYISSTTKQAAFLKPKEVDRTVVAVYFNEIGSVDRVANYGLRDGKVFDYISRKTPAPGASDEGLLKQLFRNLGNQQMKSFDPANF